MKFTDFKPEELVGKTVLYTSGMSYSTTYQKSIHKITRVTKTWFEIFGSPDTHFSLRDGEEKGLTGRQHMGVISQCELITEEYAQELKREWSINRDTKRLRKELSEKINSLTLEQLQKISELIK